MIRAINQSAYSRIRLSDVFLFLYLCATFGNRSGSGFDALFLRGTFAAYVMVSLLFDVLPREAGRRRVSDGHKLFTPLTVWFLLFVFYAYISVFWSESLKNTLQPNYITNFIQAFCLVLFIPYRIESRRDLRLIVGTLVCAALYGVMVLVIKTPSSAWGSERVGSAIGLNSNAVGLSMSFTLLFVLFLARDSGQPLLYAVCPIFIAVALFSGSRKAAFLCLAGLALVLSFSYRGAKGAVVAFVGIIIVLGVIWAIMNVSELYNVIGYRIERLLLNNGVDGSAEEREWYRQYACSMFLDKPILGYGFNGFLTQMQAIGYWHQAYSHCNQWELLSCLGVIGFVGYYGIFAKLAVTFLRRIKLNHEDAFFGSIFLILIFVSDYGNVSFVDPDIYLYLTLLYCLCKTMRFEEENNGKSVEILS